MTIFKKQQFDSILSKAGEKYTAFLFHGPNENLVADLVRQTIIAVAGSLDDPFNTVVLNENNLKDTPSILADEMQAISFGGGRKAIWIKSAGNNWTKKAAEALELPATGNVLVFQAGQLAKTSSLRKLFQKATSAACFACYDDLPGELKSMATKAFADNRISIDRDALDLLISLTGPNRKILSMEIEKLSNYSSGSGTVTARDVANCCADPAMLDLDALCDAALAGNRKVLIDQFDRITRTGLPGQQILSALLRHIESLQKLQQAIQSGKASDLSIKAARPPIYFKRIDPIKRQLMRWPLPALQKACETLLSAVSLSRKNPGLEEAICERALISLSGIARQSARR